MTWRTPQDIAEELRIGRTKAYEIAREIGVKFGATIRVSPEAWQRWRKQWGPDVSPETILPILVPVVLVAALETRDRVVYFVQSGDAGPIKIGWTANFPQRLANIQRGNAETIHCRACIWGEQVLEFKLHEAFADERLHGEWFRSSERLLRLIASLGSHSQ